MTTLYLKVSKARAGVLCWDMSASEPGNSLFSEGKYEQAVASYSDAIVCIIDLQYILICQ